MDADRFDHIAKDVGSRRRLFTALFAGIVSGALVAGRPVTAKGRKKGKGKGKKKGKNTGSCNDAYDCRPTEICWNGQCTVNCAAIETSGCPAGMTCALAVPGQPPHCTETCVAAGYYGPNPDPPKCPAGKVCHGLSGFCGAPCSIDSDCASSYRCIQEWGACV